MLKSKASMHYQSHLPKVSTRLVWLESRIGSGFLFSDNEILVSASFTSLLITNESLLRYTECFRYDIYTHVYLRSVRH